MSPLYHPLKHLPVTTVLTWEDDGIGGEIDMGGTPARFLVAMRDGLRAAGYLSDVITRRTTVETVEHQVDERWER